MVQCSLLYFFGILLLMSIQADAVDDAQTWKQAGSERDLVQRKIYAGNIFFILQTYAE